MVNTAIWQAFTSAGPTDAKVAEMARSTRPRRARPATATTQCRRWCDLAGELPSRGLEAPEELEGADEERRPDDHADDAKPAWDRVALDQGGSGQDRPGSGERLAEVLADGDAEVTVQRLKDDVDRLSSS